MKTIKIVALSLLLITLSCSKSSDDEVIGGENNIIGVWVLTDIVVDTNNSIQLQSDAQDLKDALLDLNCNLISLDIRADNTVTLEEFEYQEVFVSLDPNKPSYQCVNRQSQEGTWSFSGEVLTLTLASGSKSTAVKFDNPSIAIISGEPFEELGALASELVFEKLVGG